MASLFGGKIIAVDVIPEVDLLAEGDMPSSMSGWSVAWRHLNPFAEAVAVPNILSIMMRSATTSSQGLRRAADLSRKCALYLRPAVSRWNILDFKAAEPIADEAYRATRDAIGAWWERERSVVMPGVGG
jgi:hypothetical protein